MAVDEGRAVRNGVPLPIECLHMQLSPKIRFPSHLHYHDYTELLFGTAGHARAMVADRCYLFGPGDTVIIHPHEPHDVCAAGEDCSYTVVKFLPDVLLGGEPFSSEYGYVLLLMENAPGRQNLFRAGEIGEVSLSDLFSHILSEWERQDFGYELSLRADITHVLVHILRKWRADNPSLFGAPFERHGRVMQKAIAYVRDHCADASEEEAAAFCGLSPAYFSRLFRKSMPCGFSAYVNQVRLREAERLLLTTDDSITDIAQQLGFSTSAYFIDRFRRAYHTTPHRFRGGASQSPPVRREDRT